MNQFNYTMHSIYAKQGFDPEVHSCGLRNMKNVAPYFSHCLCFSYSRAWNRCSSWNKLVPHQGIVVILFHHFFSKMHKRTPMFIPNSKVNASNATGVNLVVMEHYFIFLFADMRYMSRLQNTQVHTNII